MWTVLLHVNPTTVTVSVFLIAICSFLISLSLARGKGDARSKVRALTAVATCLYLFVLAAPLLHWTQINTADRNVEWDPLSSFHELQQQSIPEETYASILSNGQSAFYSPHELTEEERQAELRFQPHDFFLHEENDGTITVTDQAGGEVSGADETLVLREMADGIATTGQPLEYAGLIVEEKVMNLLLFIPIGVLAFHAFTSWAARAFFGPGLSVTIECVQWALAAGRSADVADVLVNTTGAFVGVLLATLTMAVARKWAGAEPRTLTSS
ncbi:VanZ family protein [Nocardiopsis dassonvillei]|uniref:VanZ family protein n=1 Tax=Nocardiopsis dassonvillei TaxID=2014 RepID=UPI0033FCD29E